jgi:hypothetical protein
MPVCLFSSCLSHAFTNSPPVLSVLSVVISALPTKVFDDVWWAANDYCDFQSRFEKDYRDYMKLTNQKLGGKTKARPKGSGCRRASVRQFIEHEVRNI